MEDKIVLWLQTRLAALEMLIAQSQPFSKKQLYHEKEHDIVGYLLEDRKKELKENKWCRIH